MADQQDFQDVKNEVLQFIRSFNRSNNHRQDLKNKLEKLHKVVGYCPLTQQEVFILMTTFFKYIDKFKDSTFQSFLISCIPDNQLDKKFVRDLVEWLLAKYTSKAYEVKCDILLKWFYSLLNHNLIDLTLLDVYYTFLFKIIEIPCFLNTVCPLLFLLNHYGNTLPWMLTTARTLKEMNQQKKSLSLLIKKLDLNQTKSQMSGDCLFWPYPAGISTLNKILNLKHNLPSQGLANGANSTSLAINDIIKPGNPASAGVPRAQRVSAAVPLAQISTVDAFSHFFHIISLPEDILTLLSSNLGVMKTILDPEMEDEFVTKLKFKLSDMFQNKEGKYKTSECKAILSYLYKFQNLIQQGIDCVSNFLASYLKTWNGLDYKKEVLHLCEWFVFDSKLSLIHDFLKPLHLLQMTANPEDQIAYIEMYGKLYNNLLMESDKIVNKSQPRMFLSLEMGEIVSSKCAWMRQEDTNMDMFTSLGRYIMQECSTSILNSSSHREVLVYTTLDLCVKCLSAEDYFNKSLLLMIPPSIVFLPLFSTSLRNISSICFILDKYKEYQKSERLYGMYEAEFNLIDGYIEDFINFLWRGNGWNDRSRGEVFASIPDSEVPHTVHEPLQGRYSSIQINRSLHVRKHVAVVTFSHPIMKRPGATHITDKEFLDTILSKLSPTLASFIKTYCEEEIMF
uniref:Centromere protein I n=1 Tax=Cacopsylla melanoneura TaxID=428564 RepID=A0A8D8RAX4_9HEMI